MKRIDFYAQPLLVISKTNPKKKGSMAYERFENYFTLDETATVATAIKAGVRMDDIRHDTEHGFIAVGADMIEFYKAELEREREEEIKRAKELLGLE